MLERTNGRRCFRRATDEDIAGYLADTSSRSPAGPVTDAPPAPDAPPVDNVDPPPTA